MGKLNKNYPVEKVFLDGEPWKLNGRFSVTLESSKWVDNSQTLNINGITSDGAVFIVSPTTESYENYSNAGIYADDVDRDNYITFNCRKVPTNNLDVVIVKVQV